MARCDDLLSLCSPCRNDVYWLKWLNFIVTLTLIMNAHYIMFWLWITIRFNYRALIFSAIFLGEHAPRSPSISMLCMLIVLQRNNKTITHYTKGPTLTICPDREHVYSWIPSLLCALLPGESYHYTPQYPVTH